MRVFPSRAVSGVLLSLCLSWGCLPESPPSPSDGGMGCHAAPLGDPSAPMRFTPTGLGPDLVSAALKDGGMVSLIAPPQGGRVALIGVSGATNLDPCEVSLLAALRDPVSRQVRLDARTINLSSGADGLGASDDSDISTFSNVPLCPNQWSSQAIPGHDYELTVTLTDRQGRSASQTLTVRPACDVPGEAALCRCICAKDYKLGDPCPGAPRGPEGGP